MNEKGGTASVLKGNLKQRLLSLPIAFVRPEAGVGGSHTVRAVVRGLSSVLKVFVGCSAYRVDLNGTMQPLDPGAMPAGAGTMQIIPQSNFGDSPKLQFRPVFQDPTAVDHLNHPLPQAIPFSWNFLGECDEAIIEVVLDGNAWSESNLTVKIVLQVMVEYFGPWWDAEAYRLAMGQVQLSPPGSLLLFSSI